jgi:hypothetical protein
MKFLEVIPNHATDVPDDAKINFFRVNDLVYVIDCSNLGGVTVDHISVVQKKRNQTIVNFPVDLIFFLKNQNHNQVNTEQGVTKISRKTSRNASLPQHDATLLDKQDNIDKFVPIGKRNEAIWF